MKLMDLRWPLAFLLWTAAIGWCAWGLFRYESAAGKADPSPATWPTSSSLHVEPENWNLVLAIHPHCACSYATFSELEWVISGLARPPKIHVLACRPREADASWKDSPLLRQLATLAGATIIDDLDGREAQRFGALTSGYLALYDPTGELRFRGGITLSRGQIGENAGRRAVWNLLAGNVRERTKTLVHGCALRDETTSNRAWGGADHVVP